MAYPGNPSLPAEVKDRVILTFRQTVDLYKKGRKEEVITGCDFLLKMDPKFDPARQLLAKARNPALTVDVDALVRSVGDSGGDSLAAARRALKSREFERAADLSRQVLSSDLTNAEAQKIAEEAQARLEAQPFVEQFVQKAREQRAAGNESAARAAIDKAKALDPTHPALVELDREPAPMTFDFGGEASPFSSAFTATGPGATAAPATPPPAANPFQVSEPFGSPEPASPPPPTRSSFELSEPTPSFVVDQPPASTPARSTAEASDFGFTFEEDQKLETSGAAPKVIEGSAGTFDFSTASVEVAAEDKPKIAKYLEEGDQAFERGDYQKAIDLWSRIFLIDVTNDEASARIEKARAKRLEIDKKVEDLVAAGARAFDRGDSDTARAKFEEALRLDPTNFSASDYIERIDAGAIPAPGAVPTAPADDLFAEDFAATAPASDAEIPVPSAPGKEKRRVGVAAAAEERRLPMGLIGIAALVVVLLGAGAWFFMFRGGDEPASTASSTAFTEAQALAGRGEYDRAIALLSSIKPTDPQYDRALAMIADLQKRKAQAATATAINLSPSEYNDLLDQGAAAFAAHDFVAAKQAFERAAAARPLPPEARAQYEAASQQVARLQTATVLFNEGNYREAITALEELSRQDPQNKNVRQMIANAYFNLGQIALHGEKTDEAIKNFDQVLAFNPNDDLARRSRELAARYNGERKDLLYKIYVKYLPLRGV